MTNNEQKPNTCPRCGAIFTCGLITRQEHCWCFDLPKVKLKSEERLKSCLCPNCLKTLIENQQQSQTHAS